MPKNCLLITVFLLISGFVSAQSHSFKNAFSADLTGVLRNTADISYEHRVFKHLYIGTKAGYTFPRQGFNSAERNPGSSETKGWFAGLTAKTIIPDSYGNELAYFGVEYIHSSFSEKSRPAFGPEQVQYSYGAAKAGGAALNAGLISNFSRRMALETGIRYSLVYGDFSNVNKNTDVMGLLQGYPVPGFGRVYGSSESYAFQIMVRMKYRFGVSNKKPDGVLKKTL